MLDWDRRGVFRMAALQSEAGRALLRRRCVRVRAVLACSCPSSLGEELWMFLCAGS